MHIKDDRLIELCRRTEHEIAMKEKKYREKLLEDIRKSLERGLPSPLPARRAGETGSGDEKNHLKRARGLERQHGCKLG